MNNKCVCCGRDIPEGCMVCPICENGYPELNLNRVNDPVKLIRKIIDDMANKKDRYVSIFMGKYGTSISVYPLEEEKEE